LQPYRAGGRHYISQRALGGNRIGRIDEHRHAGRRGHQLTQELQPLARHLSTKKIDTCRVAPRPRKAGDKTELDWVFSGEEDDGNGLGRRLGRDCSRAAGGDDHGDPSFQQVGRQRWQSIVVALGPAVLDGHVLALNMFSVLVTLQVLAVFAEHERDMISARTKQALAAARERGVKLGGPNIAEAARLGAASNRVNADRFAANTLPIIREIQASGVSTLRGVARALTARGIPSARGTSWSPVAVSNIIKRSREGTT